MTDARTPDEIAARGVEVLDVLRRLEYGREFIIDDYPIGRSDRGQCRVSYERKTGHGWRTVRTTTDARGRWCKPKQSCYQSGVIIATHDPAGAIDDFTGWTTKNDPMGSSSITTGRHFTSGRPLVGWVRRTDGGLYLQRANYDSLWLLESVNNGTIRREDHHYAIDGRPGVLRADPPELITAFEAYASAVGDIVSFLMEQHLSNSTQAVPA